MIRKYIFYLAFSIIPFNSFSQFSIGQIQDKDGYTNLRSLPHSKSNIVSKIEEQENFVFYPLPDSDWWYVETKDTSGYVHSSRIKDTKRKGTWYKGKLQMCESGNCIVKQQTLNTVSLFYLIQKEEYGERSYFIKIMKENRLLRTIEYYRSGAVGGYNGINISKLDNLKSIVIARYGNYDGKNVFINTATGQVKSFKGGDYYISKAHQCLVSFWDSDLGGVSIYNYAENRLVELELPELASDLQLYTYNARLYVSDYDNTIFKEVDFDNMVLKPSTIDKKLVMKPSNQIKFLMHNHLE